jgi:hypothetical protein
MFDDGCPMVKEFDPLEFDRLSASGGDALFHDRKSRLKGECCGSEVLLCCSITGKRLRTEDEERTV